jgi:hypothetical protein
MCSEKMRHLDTWSIDNIYIVNGYNEIRTEYGPSVSYENFDQLQKFVSFCLLKLKRPLLGKEMVYLMSDQIGFPDIARHINFLYPDRQPLEVRELYMMHIRNEPILDVVDKLIRRLVLDNSLSRNFC